MIRSVPADQLREVYPQVREYFESFAQGDVQKGELEAEILTGVRQCYVAVVDGKIKGCALSTVSPTGRVTLDFCAGRDREEWGDDMLDMFVAWARDLGRGLRVVCRPGWVRALDMKGRGLRETHRVMEVDYGR